MVIVAEIARDFKRGRSGRVGSGLPPAGGSRQLPALLPGDQRHGRRGVGEGSARVQLRPGAGRDLAGGASLRGPRRPTTRRGAGCAACALIGPTLAALVLLSVLGIYPVQRNVAHMEHAMQRMNLVGEVACYGLTDGATRTAPTQAKSRNSSAAISTSTVSQSRPKSMPGSPAACAPIPR